MSRLSRRDFMRRVGGAVLATLLSGCASPGAPSRRVAIARAATYDRSLIRQQVEAMVEALGGLADIIRPGAKVVLKPNLLSGPFAQYSNELEPTQGWATHPEVVRAVGELARDAGAGELYIAEGIYDVNTYVDWGYQDIARGLNATLINLNLPAPFAGFATLPVGEGWRIYEKFSGNAVLEEADAFISVAKMKCHSLAGVTLSMKNLVGMLPVSLYSNAADYPNDMYRLGLHGGDNFGTQLPRVIIDLNRARPIHLAVIDGVMTIEGGEFPWTTHNPVRPGVLVAGKNALATDAVATAIMSFDPTISRPEAPFLYADNYLNLANDLGMGTDRLDDIDIVGARIEDVRHKFEPARTASCWAPAHANLRPAITT